YVPYFRWSGAAQACGVENVSRRRVSLVRAPRIEGARPPFAVAILPRGGLGSTDALSAVSGVSAQLRLRHETLRTQASKLAGAKEELLGDAEFDAQFFVGGDPVTAHALLDAPARALALDLLGPRPLG